MMNQRAAFSLSPINVMLQFYESHYLICAFILSYFFLRTDPQVCSSCFLFSFDKLYFHYQQKYDAIVQKTSQIYCLWVPSPCTKISCLWVPSPCTKNLLVKLILLVNSLNHVATGAQLSVVLEGSDQGLLNHTEPIGSSIPNQTSQISA